MKTSRDIPYIGQLRSESAAGGRKWERGLQRALEVPHRLYTHFPTQPSPAELSLRASHGTVTVPAVTVTVPGAQALLVG